MIVLCLQAKGLQLMTTINILATLWLTHQQDPDRLVCGAGVLPAAP